MNPLNINHIKIERANSIKLRYKNIRKVTNFFRIFEVFLIVAVISRIPFQIHLPFAFVLQLSNECFRALSLILLSPSFGFIAGNAIIIILFIYSGQSKAPCNVKTPKKTILGSKNQKQERAQPKEQGKTEENKIITAIFAPPVHQTIKVYERSKSEVMRRDKVVESVRLRRSNTEIKSLKGSCAHSSVGCCKNAPKDHYPEDHMTKEEFRRTIEDFIAKQQRFLKQEEDLVLCS